MVDNFIKSQRISQKKKYANDAEWGRKMANWLIPNFISSGSYVQEYNKDLENYRLYNNEINEQDFERVCNPLGIDVGQYDEEVMPYNRTYTKIDVLLGEERKRGDNFVVTLLNEKAIDEKDEEIKKLYKDFIASKIEAAQAEAMMRMQGASPEQIQAAMQEIEIAKTPQDLDIVNYLSEKEIFGNSLINYAMFDQKVKSKKNDGFKHALLSDKEFVYVGLEHGQPVIKLMNPLTMFYQKNPDVKFIQDGDWAGHRTQMSLSSVIEQFGHKMKEKDLKRLESRIGYGGTSNIPKKSLELDRENTLRNRYVRQFQLGQYIDDKNIGSYGGGTRTSDRFFPDEMIWVTHVEWVSQRKVVFVTSIDQYGEEQERMEDESYPIPKDARKVDFINIFGDKDKRWEWVDEEGYPMKAWETHIPRVWEANRIDDDVEGIFFDVQEKPNQYTSIENPFKCKLGYHGLVYNNMNADYISLMARMKPYQFLYFVAMHEMKKLLSSNRGLVPALDTSQIDTELGKEVGKDPTEMTFFMLDQRLWLYNSQMNNEGANATPLARPQPSSVSLDNTPAILNLREVLSWLDFQIGESCGVSKDREGGISPREAVANARQNITQQSHITEHYFQKHNELWREVLESYILTTQVAWEGKSVTKQYVLPDSTLQTLKIRENSYDNADFGLFVANSGQTKAFFEDLRHLALPALQNDNKLSDVVDILKAIAEGTSVEQVSKMIKESEIRRDAHQQQMQEQEAEKLKEIERMRIEAREDEQAHELEKIRLEKELEKEKALLVASIQASSFNDYDFDNDGIPDPIEMMKHGLNVQIQNKKLDLEKKKHEDNVKLSKEKMAIDRKKLNKPSSTNK